MQTQQPTKLQVQWLVEKQWKRWLWIGAIVLVILWIAYLAREIWLPLAVAFLIAMVLDPVVDRLEARGWTRTAGAALIYSSFILVVGGALFFAIPVLINEGETLGGQVNHYLPNRTPQGIDEALQKAGVAAPAARSIIVMAATQLETSIHHSGAWLAQNGLSLVSNLIWIVIIPIVAFYALRDFHLILATTLLLVPPGKRETVQTFVAEITAIFAKYMRGLMTVSLLNGLATWLLLQVLGVPNAFMLGCIAGALYSVPYLGAIITVVLVAAMSFVSGGLQYMLIVVALNILLHQIIFDQVISPRILGGQVGLHPILAIMALLIGNAILGIVGMILAVPIAASIQVAVVAIVPKLSQQIDLSTTTVAMKKEHAEAEVISEETKEQQIKTDVTEELHKGVEDAVAQVEATIEEERVRDEEELANLGPGEGTSDEKKAS